MSKSTPSFTTWEKYQLAYIGRRLGRKLTEVEKCAIVLQLGWRGEKIPDQTSLV